MVISHTDLLKVAPFLATLSLIAVRMMPSVSRLSGSLNSYKMSLPVVEDLIDCFEYMTFYTQHRKKDGIRFIGDYEASGLHFGYGSRFIINGADIIIPEGKIVLIYGESGSGKSTLLDLLVGLQKPSSGSFRMGGISFDPYASSDFCQHVGYVPQQITLLEETIEFNICLSETVDQAKLARVIKKVHLEGFIRSLEKGIHTFLGDGFSGISGGQRQRLGIARALYRDPSLLILDEVTSALDDVTARSVMKDLHLLRGETSLLFVAHDMRFIAADWIYEMADGRLVKRETIGYHFE